MVLSNGHANGVQPQGNKELRYPSVHDDTVSMTTNVGTPVVSNQHSESVSRRGPVLMEDYHLVEKLAQFNRGKIPERVVHARGMTAKGYFETTHDVTDICSAEFLSEVGRKTPLIARFSTVVHESGSPESLRDTRGFSVKFYTNEGNWDFVGNNMPVFFVRDGIKFPDLIRCLRPNPKNHLQEGWRILDFLSHHPESIFILMWLLGPRGIPADWRHMEGFGVHTFKMVNKAGKETYVKFHWKPTCGVKVLTDEEAKEVGMANNVQSHATEDLWNTIESGEFPEWKLYIQTMEIEDELKYDFDPLDASKIFPEDQFPLQPVGRMVLDRNIDNFFNEQEMVAFNPGVTPPGIRVSDDKLLQSRVFAYSDAQRYRLGANYQLLPVNAPKCPYKNNHYEGTMNITQRDEEVNYHPSQQYDIDDNAASKSHGTAWTSPAASGPRVKQGIEKENNFQQPGEYYRSFDRESKDVFQKHLLTFMTHPKCSDAVQKTWIGFMHKTDAELGKEIEQKFNDMQKKN